MDPHRDSPVTEESRTRGEISIIQFKLFDPKLYAFHFKSLSYNDDNYDDNDFILHCTLLSFCWTYTCVSHLHMICTIVYGIIYVYFLLIKGEEVHSRCFDGCITCNTNYVGFFSNLGLGQEQVHIKLQPCTVSVKEKKMLNSYL